ncbi:MAG: RNA 2',3'-cyclic phosphodiesterase [Chloroflexi bacterium]|nr:RNA 2',3'-cyclic phosphodiesterase [Chloroflexota bacterium]
MTHPAPAPLRLFIAIDLTPAVRDGLRREIDRLARLAPPRALRWTRPEGIHLTLKFLGDTPAGRVDEIAAVLAGAADQGPFTFSVGGLGYFPDARQPRVLWVGLSEPTGALAALQRRVEQGAARLGYPAEGRAFNPHLTVARVARQASPEEKRRLVEALAGQSVPALGEVHAGEMALFRSQLLPGGAVYTRLRAVPL